jgi:hypothetical protein
MAEGHLGLDLPKHMEAPFIKSKTYNQQIKPNQQILQLEVKRQFNAYISQGKEPKPSAWTIAACTKWLLKNKIPSDDEFKEELPYIRSQLHKYKVHVTAMVLLDKAAEGLNTSKNWRTLLPYYACILISCIESPAK